MSARRLTRSSQSRGSAEPGRMVPATAWETPAVVPGSTRCCCRIRPGAAADIPGALVLFCFAWTRPARLIDAANVCQVLLLVRTRETSRVSQAGAHSASQFKQTYAFFKEAFADHRVEILNVVATKNQVVVGFVGRGTHSGPLRLPAR